MERLTCPSFAEWLRLWLDLHPIIKCCVSCKSASLSHHFLFSQYAGRVFMKSIQGVFKKRPNFSYKDFVLQHFKHCPLQSSPLYWWYTVPNVSSTVGKLPGTHFLWWRAVLLSHFPEAPRDKKKRPNILNSSPTSTEGALRLLSAPSGRFWQQTVIFPFSLWALVVVLHPLNWERAQAVR
jgi:hypothetical protein